MRYSTEPRKMKYVEGYSLLSFEKKMEINMIKN